MTIHLQPCTNSPALHHRRDALDALSDATHWVFAGLRGTFGEWRRRSRARAELAALDERALRDIGLTRGDAQFLISKPFWRE